MTRMLRFTLLPALVGIFAACGGDDGPPTSAERISNFDTNDPIRFPGGGGGYTWSYKDTAGSRVEPESSETVPFAYSSGGHSKRAAKVSFAILPEPAYSIVGTDKWKFKDTAGCWGYPTGGFGISLKEKNAPASIPKTKLGIKFWAKGSGSAVQPGITVEFPTADTDVAGPNDAFTTSCTVSAAMQEDGETPTCEPENGAKLSSHPDKLPHTCFANFYRRVKLTEDWQQYAVLFKDLFWADQDPETGIDKDYPWVDREELIGKEMEGTDDPKGWDRRRVLKIQFAAYRAPAGEKPEVGEGEMWIDDLEWVVEKDGITESGPVSSDASSNE